MPGLILTTQQLEYLLAVDRAETWTAAAAHLGVTTSALSQGIAELERRLGLTLFERSGRRRVPSPDHAEVLRFAERTIASTRDLERWIERRRRGTAGEVRLGLIDAAATHHFGQVLRDFREGRPEVDLRLTVAPSSELLAALSRAELDLVVCVGPARAPSDLVIEGLLDDPLTVLAPPGATVDAAWGPWVSFPQGSHTREIVSTALREDGRTFEVVAESHQPDVLREMVALGIGWAVLPRAGLGSTSELVIARTEFASRRLVLARRRDAAPDGLTDQLASSLRRASDRAA